MTISAGSAISANAGNHAILGQNQQIAGMNAAGGAIDIIANQGRVITEAGSTISATGSPGGTIRIIGGQEARIASVLNASSPSRGAADTAGTLVLITAQDIGGRIEVLSPVKVNLEPGAQLLASGDAGGGTILVGGDYQGANAQIVNAQDTNVSQGVLLEANARVNGNGGKAIVWADNDTHFSGTLHAKGGEQGGDGGFGETSGKKNLYFRGRADLTARRGRTGTLLLDPDVILIQGGTGTSDPNFASGTINAGASGTLATIYEDDLEAIDLMANILLEATNKISFGSTAFGDNGLVVSKDLTLRTTNPTATAFQGVRIEGMSLALMPQFTIQAGGNIVFESGTAWTPGVSGPDVLTTNISSAEKISIISTGGSITMKAAGGVSLGGGTVLIANKNIDISTGNFGNSANGSSVVISSPTSTTGVQIQGENVSIVANGSGAQITANKLTSITATGAATGNILLESTSKVSLAPGVNLTANNGDITLHSKSSNVLLSSLASAPVEISSLTITLQSSAVDGLIDIQGNNSSLNATATGTAITLRGDRLAMDSTATVVATNGAIEVRPWTGSRTILIGGTIDSSGQGNLQSVKKNLIICQRQAAPCALGDTTAMSGAFTGDIHVAGPLSFALGNSPVALLTTGGQIYQSQALSANQLRLQAGSITINSSAGNNFYQLAAKSTGGTLNIVNGALTTSLETVDGLSGLQSAGALSLSNNNTSDSELWLTSNGFIRSEGNINIASFETLKVFGSNFIVDSNVDNSGNSGNINLDTGMIQPSTSGRGLTLTPQLVKADRLAAQSI
ncbi:MAG: hypothetical protein HC765_03985 [Brachymonas sp.]|nr:hypothetical protein [Brachymonas sp.]